MGAVLLFLALQNPWNEPPARIQVPVDVYLYQLREVQKCGPMPHKRIWVSVEIGWCERVRQDTIEVELDDWTWMMHTLTENPGRIGLMERMRNAILRR